MKILTLETLKQMPPHSIIAHGETIDNPDGINIDNSNHNLYWVAKRGEIHDWAIYVCPYPWTQKGPEINATELANDMNHKLRVWAHFMESANDIIHKLDVCAHYTELVYDIFWKLEVLAYYIQLDQQDIIKSCSEHGTKLQNVQNIQKLIPCNDETLNMYRH